MNKVFEVLLVEDDSADVDLFKEALNIYQERPFGIHLNVVEDGEEAIHFLNKTNSFTNVPRPDLILLDLNMPRKSGFEVLDEIKRNDKFKVIPVVIFTTSSAQEDIKRSYTMGANSFISKARDFTEFAKIIRAVEGYWFQVSTLAPSR